MMRPAFLANGGHRSVSSRAMFVRGRRNAALLACLLALGCAGNQGQPKWPADAQKWFDRADYSFQSGDMDDAQHASERALKLLPDEPEVRLMAARIALAQLDFERSVELAKDLPGGEAAAVRGRAHWYLGQLEKAADELELAVADPEVRDPWAEQVARLARTGRGRRPFELSGGLLAVTEMPRVGNTAMVVPIELNGEPTLAVVATDMAEAVIDSRQDGEGAWVSVRFGGRLEVSDVPAMGRDLSGLSRQVGAPVKMLIGVNLLRHVRATIDFSGRQFVARNYEPPAPPEGTAVRPIFYRGGAMVLPGAFGAEQSAPSSLLMMNTSLHFPIALDEAGWKKAGQDPSTFAAVPGQAGMKHGMVPMLRLGAFEIPNVPGVIGPDVSKLEETLGVSLDGFAGSGLFATFRLTFADDGRTLYVEDLPAEVIQERMRAAEAISRRAQEQAEMPDMKLSAPGMMEVEEGAGDADGHLPPPPTSSSQSDNPRPGTKPK